MAQCLSGRISNLENDVFEILNSYYMSTDAECVISAPNTSCQDENRCSSAPTGSRMARSASQRQNVPTHLLYSEEKTTKSKKPHSLKKSSSNKSNKLPKKTNQSERDSTSSNKTKNPSKHSPKLSKQPKTPSGDIQEDNTLSTSSMEFPQFLYEISRLHSEPASKFFAVKSESEEREVVCSCFDELSSQEGVVERVDSLEKLRGDLAQVKHMLKEKVEQMQSQALKSMKKIAKDNTKLTNALKMREKQIKVLSEAGDQLKKECEVKEDCCKRMMEEHELLKTRLVECVEGNRCLAVAKDKLASIVDEQQIRINALVIEVERLKNDLTKEVRVEEVGVDAVVDSIASNRREKELEMQVIQLRQNEITYLDELEKYKIKVNRMKCDQNCLREKYDKKMENLQNENANLMATNKHLIDTMKHENSELIKKSDLMQLEFRKMTLMMKDKEASLLKERDQLKNLARELTDITKEQNKRIDELIALNQTQEKELEIQKTEMLAQGNEINSALNESDSIKKQYEMLRCEFQEYKNQSVDPLKFESALKDLEETKESLNKLTETVALKEIIIHEQFTTIQQQRSNIQELKSILERRDIQMRTLQQVVKNTNNRLSMEINNNATIRKTLMEVQKQNEAFVRKVYDLERVPQGSGDGTIINNLIASIEEKMAMQRREWETERQLMWREKARALTTAEFTTKKLLETSMDMQRNAAVHRHVQNLLIGLLQEKELQLKLVRDKITCLHMSGPPRVKNAPTSIFNAPERPQLGDQVVEQFKKTVYNPPQCKIYNPRTRSIKGDVQASSGSSIYASTKGSKELQMCRIYSPSKNSTSLLYRNLTNEEESYNCLVSVNRSVR